MPSPGAAAVVARRSKSPRMLAQGAVNESNTLQHHKGLLCSLCTLTCTCHHMSAEPFHGRLVVLRPMHVSSESALPVRLVNVLASPDSVVIHLLISH